MSNRALTWAFDQSTGGPGSKSVLVALADMADEENSCWPSQERLARMTDQGERSVRRHLAALEAQGFIKREQRYINGHRTSDRYVLPVVVLTAITQPASLAASKPAKLAGTTKAATVAAKNQDKSADDRHLIAASLAGTAEVIPAKIVESTGQIGQVTQREPSLTTTTKRASSTAVDAGAPAKALTQKEQFERFWVLYPRKVAKQAAWSKFTVAIKRASFETIMAGCQRYRDDPHRVDEFTTHPTTWLSQGRWEDDPLPARKSEQRTEPAQPQWRVDSEHRAQRFGGLA